MSYTCRHGNRNIRSGESANGPWCAAFCPTPKGTANQCPPIWLNPDGTPKDDDAQRTHSPRQSHPVPPSGGAGEIKELVAAVRELTETLCQIHGIPPKAPADRPMPTAAAMTNDEIDIDEIPF